jgi:hypothetical protein
MAAIESIENDFQSFLLTGGAAIERSVVGTERVSVATRLAIYGNAYRSRLIETLEGHYPALLALMGEAAFGELAAEYVQAHDSTFASIRYYGGALGAFLAAHPEHEACPWLCELARFEWAMTEVFDAADATPIEARSLAEIAPQDWAELRFELHPALRRLDLMWNAPALWRALTAAEPAPPAEPQAQQISWLLWRRELQIFFRPLAPAEAAALAAVCAGQSFGELCDGLSLVLNEEQAPAAAAGFLREWVHSGMIIGTRASEE